MYVENFIVHYFPSFAAQDISRLLEYEPCAEPMTKHLSLSLAARDVSRPLKYGTCTEADHLRCSICSPNYFEAAEV
jgi:hypothetical protein